MRAFAYRNGRRAVDTVYFGGGTPSLLPIESFESIFKALSECFSIDVGAEITVECNPATVSRESLESLRRLGVNRLSIGLQSANENELRALGRLHSFEELCESFALAREVGFDNISLDLMYGIPEQTIESFENSLLRVCELSPEHISAYGLKIEDGTAFGRMRDSLVLPDEDEEYSMYTLCRRLLEAHGYERYEISNFAKLGYESRHNMRYWKLDDYIGFGVAAHSCFEGERFGNSRDIAAFLRGEDIVEERYTVNADERRREYVMLGLRLGKGIADSEYRALCGRGLYDDMPMIEKFVSAGYLVRDGERIAFSDEGFFVSNAILSELLNSSDNY
jgi:oxygen-independent coproporphyrinogen-3 oxidase